MSTYITLFCSSFHLAKGQESISAIGDLIEKHMDGEPLELACGEKGGVNNDFSIEMEGAEVDDSFGDRVSALVKGMAPHVTECFHLTLRSDSMSDERDRNIFGGPSPESVEESRQAYYIKEALNWVGGTGPKLELARRLLQGILSGESETELVDPQDIQVFVALNGGVVERCVGTHPIDLVVFDSDVEGADIERIVQDPAGDDVIVIQQNLEIDPAYCDELRTALKLDMDASNLDEDDIAQWLKRRIEDGELSLEDLPIIMARYALGDPNALRMEIAERMHIDTEVELDPLTPYPHPVSQAAMDLDKTNIAAWLERRIGDGELSLEDLPIIMARYALGDPNALRMEIVERIENGPENPPADSASVERNT